MNEWTAFTRSIPQGDSHIFRYRIVDTDGVAINIGAGGPYGQWANFWMTAKYRPGDTDAAAVFQKTYSPAAGITIVDTTTGLLQVEILPADTVALVGVRRSIPLVADIQGKDGNGRIWTSKRGLVVVQPVTTRAA